MKIGGIEIGPKFPPFIIAEISCNHGGSLEAAKRLVRLAKQSGASAAKTQCYTADTLTLRMNKPDFIIQDGLWKGKNLWELYDKAHTPFEWHKDLYKVAHDEDLVIFTSVFDRSAVDYLEKLGCPAYKIASMEISDTVLIEHAAKTGKPLIISTGMASDVEILDAYEASDKMAAFLHCTSEYPGTIETSNLGKMRNLMVKFPKNLIGISDHTEGSLIPIAATAMGACIIEKHFGHLDGVKSEDDEFSLGPDEFRFMASQARLTWAALQPHEDKKNPSRQFRRSLYAVENIKKGDLFSEKNIRSIRPGYGLPCKMFPYLLGKKAPRDFRKGEPLSMVY